MATLEWPTERNEIPLKKFRIIRSNMNTVGNITACRGFIQKRILVLQPRKEHRFTV